MATGGNEAFSRVVIDALLQDVGWNLTDGRSVRYEYALQDGTRADYVLSDRNGRALAVVEAKRFSVNPADAAAQARTYAEQLKVPFVFLSNGRETRFWEYAAEGHPRPVTTFFSQDNLERRAATRKLRTDPLAIPIDRKVVERDYQVECIDALCREIKHGRRKLLVEMATGSGKTRMAAAFIKRLFEANAVTRVLFLVDRISLAVQTESSSGDRGICCESGCTAGLSTTEYGFVSQYARWYVLLGAADENPSRRHSTVHGPNADQYGQLRRCHGQGHRP